MNTQSQVPKALRAWFVVHFWADILFAVPLFIAPVAVLDLLGWQQVDPFTTRLAAAALFGIGIESLLGRNAEIEVFKSMLNLKVIWSATATIGIAWSLLDGVQGRPFFGWVILGIFASFHGLWLYWRLRLSKQDGSAVR